MPETNRAHITQIQIKLWQCSEALPPPTGKKDSASSLQASLDLGEMGEVKGAPYLPSGTLVGWRSIEQASSVAASHLERGQDLIWSKLWSKGGLSGKWEFPSKSIPVLMGSLPSWLSNTRPTDCSFRPQWQALSRAI